MSAFFGRKIAIDASMCLYQFIIAIRAGPDQQNLTDDSGEITSHLQGMFNRTLRLMDHGIKPVYVFDGKPPTLKGGELEKRKERRAEAEAELKAAIDEESKDDIEKFQRRTVYVTKEQNAECKRLLKLMGVPYVEAPGEAEATCAAMTKAGLVYATGTEDMDALTFDSPRLIRNLMAAEARGLPITEIDLERALEALNMTRQEFIDLCILLGCDYTGTIRGIGPKKAFDLIRQYKTIEEALKHIDKEKYPYDPEDFMYKEAAELFKQPEVADVSSLELKWTAPDEEGLMKFLVEEKGFNPERVQRGIERLKKARQAGTQQRLENYFTVIPGKRRDNAAAAAAAAASSTSAKGKKVKR